MNKIIVLEGADGTGKSTLANILTTRTKGHIFHCSWDKDWNIEDYHESIMEAAIELSNWQTVVIDRWALSELVYGNVFRNGPSYDVRELMDQYRDKITWVYCHNDNTVLNHIKNAKNREEMFDSMKDIVKEFDKFINKSNLPWIKYNFNKSNINKVVEDILNA